MKHSLIALTLLAVMPAGAVLAGDDCHVPQAAWQTREAATQAAISRGWRIEKIKADDGCWEVKGLDAQGRRIKAKLDPATLQVVKLRHRDGEQDRKRDRGGATPVAPSAPPANPLFQNGTPPVVRVN